VLYLPVENSSLETHTTSAIVRRFNILEEYSNRWDKRVGREGDVGVVVCFVITGD